MTAVLTFPVRELPQPSPAESSKILKATLRAAFPTTTFSVRLSRGTAYGNAWVNWLDGPSMKAVDAVVAPFVGEGFDGSDDSTYSIPGHLPDGRPTGLSMILTSRTISPRFARRIAAQLAAFYGEPAPEILDGARFYQLKNSNIRLDAAGEWWSTMIHRASMDRTAYLPSSR